MDNTSASPEGHKVKKFRRSDFTHAEWMLVNQINSPAELIALWKHFPNGAENAPYSEYRCPWWAGLEDVVGSITE